MSSSIQKNKFTQSILALIFFVMLCAPVVVSFEKNLVMHDTQSHRDKKVVLNSVTITAATAYALDLPQQTTTDKKNGAGSDTGKKVIMWLGNMLLGIGAFFAWVTGNLLDKSLKELVFNMGGLINTGGVGIAIDAAWKIIRDLCNLAFIFGFIYLGIRTIIDFDNSSVKKALSQIIVGAFLINFSLYIAKFVVDFSNFTAFTIYNAMVTNSGSISSIMFDQLGVTTFYSTGGLDPSKFAAVTGNGMVAFYIMGMILLLVAAFVFLAGAILLITRFVALVFLMIGSPVLFAATVFPQTENTAKKLWGLLFSYSFFAPLYLLLTLISMMILKSFTSVMRGSQDLSSTFTNSTSGMDAFGVVVSFVVVIYFLIESLLIAKKFSLVGGERAISYGHKFSDGLRKRGQVMVGNSTAGLAAATARASVGQGAYKMSQSKNLQDRAATSWLAKQQLKAATKVADSSFDARNIKGIGKAIGVGEGRKGGYTTVKKETETEHMKFAASLGEVGEDDTLVSARKSALKAAEDKQKEMKRRMEDMPKDDIAGRAKLRDELDKIETEISESKNKLDQEKNRRVLGSSFTVDEHKQMIDAAKKKHDDVNKELKDGWEEYANLANQGGTEVELAILRTALESKEKQTLEAKKKLSELAATSAGQKGYAAKLQESGKLKSWVAGRLVSHEKAAGDSIKKAYEKKLRKTKDEVQNEAIVEAIKSSNKA